MDPREKEQLEKLRAHHDYEDNTEGIRRLKNSHLIRADIIIMEKLKTEHAVMRTETPAVFSCLCQRACSFLYNSYTDIYHRLYKDELDLTLMEDALVTLEKIEDGQINQEEGSVIMGKLFYMVFVESAMKKHAEAMKYESQPKIDYSWKDYKRQGKRSA